MFRHKLLLAIHVHAQGMLIIVLAAVYTFAPITRTSAADLLNRKITIGSSRPNETTTHSFNFNIMSSSAIGSIGFEYCENSPVFGTPCIPPPGLDVSGVSLTNQTGETGFSLHPNTTANRIVITRTSVAAVPQPAYYEFSNAVNPSTPQQTVFVRVSTFAANDATGSSTDSGAVVFYITSNLIVTGFVPPYLTFCTGVTVATDCSTTNGDFIGFGELSRTVPAAATSEFSGATNDPAGYNVAVYGNTMTSGNNVIPALFSNGGSTAGTSQYGLNLRQNSAPSVGQNPTGFGTAVATPNYAIPNSFRFVSTETLASSALPTQFNKFTVSYIVNVSANQDPGIYATTMTYIATAAF